MAKKKSSSKNCHLGEQCKLDKHHAGECNPQPEVKAETEENNESQGDE